jgi:hypothetical protein
MPDLSDDELLAELGVNVEPPKAGAHTAREERIIAGFEDIQRFFESNSRAPRHGEALDIFERLYAVRLDRLRASAEARQLLVGLDTHGLLAEPTAFDPAKLDALDDAALLAELGAEQSGERDIHTLKYVSSRDERRLAEEIAGHTACKDFDQFRPLFEQAEADLQTGIRQTQRFGGEATSIDQGRFFILGGQTVYVADVGETIQAPNGESDARLRVIYSNGTESNILRRSLQRALYKDEAGRRLTEPTAGPLFSETWEVDDIASGTIYVLRSRSNHPFVTEHRELIHKIGVTGGKIETRIANAAHDATYLLAEVEVVASYKLSGINRTKLENLFHRIFAAAQIELTIPDRFGHLVSPREWFLVPLQVIDETVERIRNGSITDVTYDPASARLVKSGCGSA